MIEHEQASVLVCHIPRRPLVAGRVPVSHDEESGAAVAAQRSPGVGDPAVGTFRRQGDTRSQPWRVDGPAIVRGAIGARSPWAAQDR